MVQEHMIRRILINAFLAHADGHIKKHVANVEVLLASPVGIGEHGDIISEIEKELHEVAKYEDLVEVMLKYIVGADGT